MYKPSEIEQALTMLEIAGHNGTLSRSHLSRIEGLKKLIPKMRPAVQEFLAKISQEGRGALPPPKTILLVEDDESFDHSTEQILTGVGHTVIVALDPIKALPIFDKNQDKIDLAVIDMEMRLMNGPQLAKAMNSNEKRLEALFMVNRSEEAIRPEDMPQGELLTKPFSPEQLVGAIRAIFEKGGLEGK